MPKYSTALGGGLAGIMKSMTAGRQGARIGADTATKDAYMLSQMGNLDAAGQTKLAKAAADTFRTDAQSALFNDPTRRTERALELNGVLGGDAQQIQQVIADPKLMATFGDDLGMSREQLSRIQRTRGALANQFELTGDTNADQFTQGLNTALERGDFEGVLANPETALGMNVAQAAKDGRLFDSVGDTGMTLNRGTGDQVVGNAPVYQAGLGRTQSEIRENDASARRSDRATDTGAPGYLAKPSPGYRWSADGSRQEPIPGGPADPASKAAGATTEDAKKAAGYAKRMDLSIALMDKIVADGADATGGSNEVIARGFDVVGLGNFTRSPENQRLEAARLDALDAALTLNTGAAYTKEQLTGLAKSYFPQPGDNKKTVEEKAARFKNVVDTARMRAGQMTTDGVLRSPAKNPSQPAKIRSIPAATDWLTRQNIQTTEQARKAVAELTAKGWTRNEIERAFDGAGL